MQYRVLYKKQKLLHTDIEKCHRSLTSICTPVTGLYVFMNRNLKWYYDTLKKWVPKCIYALCLFLFER